MLLPVAAEALEAVSQGIVAGHEVAPGWPHEDTVVGLSYLRTGGVGFLIIDDDGRVAGECGTKAAPDADGTVEIGYGLAPPSRGRGLGRRAVGELVDWLGEQPDVTTIEAEIHVSNTASRRVVERLGFVADGVPTQGYLRYRRAANGGRS
jgi:ribosomal-protein-alanine N-acetyltransferase